MKPTQTDDLPPTRQSRHSMRPVWVTAVGLACSLALTVIIFYRPVESASLFPSNILLLTMININVILVFVLLLLLSRNLIKLYFERRHKLLGAGFRAKLVAAFVGLTLIPTFLLFGVASGLISSSVENWFGIQIEESLKDSLDVAQNYYETTKQRTLILGRAISRESAREAPSAAAQQQLLDQLFETSVASVDFATVAIYDHDGHLLARHTAARDQHHAGSTIPKTAPIDKMLADAGHGSETLATFPTDAGDLLRAVFPVVAASASGASRVQAVVVVDSIIPYQMTGKLDAINRAIEDYHQLKALKNPIKGIYVVLFLAVTLLIVFSATWFGFYIARGITGPIQKLLEGTRTVAGGDLTVHIEAGSTDELKELVDSFNRMTDDLRLSKAQIEAVNQSLRRSNIELEQRRAYIETVLETIATGVIATDQEGQITTFNRSAEMILQSRPESIKGRHYEEVFKHYQLELLIDDIHHLIRQNGETVERDVVIEIGGRSLTLRLSLALLRGHSREFMGAVVVFDDLSELLKAQKLAAWQEVARRIAHEIKNPLTPILLATERLRKKFVQSPDEFAAIFDESTRIVINEVNALKTMVDEFSNFARMPMPSPQPCDLHALLQEVVFLYRSAHKDIEVSTQLADALPMLILDPLQMKRLFVNLFENAVAAMTGRGKLRLTTHYQPGQSSVKICVSDEGIGIPPEDLDKLFLPYFSKRRGGTGLGLAIVHRIVTDHNGHINASPNHPRGTTITIELPVPTPS